MLFGPLQGASSGLSADRACQRGLHDIPAGRAHAGMRPESRQVRVYHLPSGAQGMQSYTSRMAHSCMWPKSGRLIGMNRAAQTGIRTRKSLKRKKRTTRWSCQRKRTTISRRRRPRRRSRRQRAGRQEPVQAAAAAAGGSRGRRMMGRPSPRSGAGPPAGGRAGASCRRRCAPFWAAWRACRGRRCGCGCQCFILCCTAPV